MLFQFKQAISHNKRFYSKHKNHINYNNNYNNSYNNNYNNNKGLVVLPKQPTYDVNHIIDVINNKKLPYSLKVRIIETYCSIMDNPLYKTNSQLIYKNYYEKAINEYQTDPETKIINDILSRDEPTKTILLNYFDELKESGKKNDESKKRLDWIKHVLKLPTKHKDIGISDHEQLINIRTNIDKEIYQMNPVKDDLLSIIYNYASNPKSTHNSVALWGPPGTGKTHLLKCFAQHAKIPYVQLSIGNINDASYLIGSSYTYVHSEPGHIVKSINRMGYKNGIIFLDEIDKISNSDRGSEVLGTMMHLCDFTQNSAFEDKYLSGIPIDMSNYLFVYSLNDIDKMNKALLSRIGQNMIKVPDYTLGDKIIIGEQYIIPKLLSDLNINPELITFPNQTISYIITDCIPIASKGIRELKGILFKIIRLIKYYNKINPMEFKFPLILTNQTINTILNKSNHNLSTNKYIL